MRRAIVRLLRANFDGTAGYFHIADPAPFLMITPGWVPMPREIISVTGIAEIAEAIALLQPWSHQLRRSGAAGLAVYAVCVLPANINHFAMGMAREDGGAGLPYHVPRMFAQPVIIRLSLWAGEVINWPLRLRR